jgi:signal-transduction protein with cAMP-binding, CBS, and nucleotidyltransferase domain
MIEKNNYPSCNQTAKNNLVGAMISSNENFKVFKDLPLVKSMTQEHAMLLFSCMEEKTFKEGEVVYEAGGFAEGEMYLILTGKVAVKDKSAYRYASLYAGDVFGLFSFLDEARKHSATIQAEKNVTVLTLERSCFDLITLEDPKLGQHLMYFMFRLLSEKALRMEVEYAHIHQFALGGKV